MGVGKESDGGRKVKRGPQKSEAMAEAWMTLTVLERPSQLFR